jgi:NitT/TauT family transport system ATP-binding protein
MTLSKRLMGLDRSRLVKGMTLQPPQPAQIKSSKGGILIEDVTIAFKQRNRKTVAVEEVSLAVKPGEFVSLLGASGCGKSTLLNAIAGIIKPSAGQVFIDGISVREPNPTCNIVFQHHSLFPWMTALQNIAFGPKMLGFNAPEEIAMKFLTLVGLERFKDCYPSMLSGGMQQRVGIARALATQPPVLLMDEPFGALDAQTRSIMQEELLKIWTNFKTTVVFVTHDVDEAIFLSDRIFIMQSSPGSIKEEVTVDLPRPRLAEMVSTDAFLHLRKTVMGVIRQESLKSFNQQT